MESIQGRTTPVNQHLLCARPSVSPVLAVCFTFVILFTMEKGSRLSINELSGSQRLDVEEPDLNPGLPQSGVSAPASAPRAW